MPHSKFFRQRELKMSSSSLHGKYLSIANVDELNALEITRNNFLDKKLVSDVITSIDKKEGLLFLGNDVCEPTKKKDYNLIIHGILPCGSKTTIIVDGIFPYVDVELLVNETKANAKTRLNRLVDSIDEDSYAVNIEFKEGKQFLHYSHKQNTFARVFFKTLKTRTEFIKLCEGQGIKTFSNDKSTYYRVVARDYEINLSGWNRIAKYHRVHNSPYKSEYVFNVHIEDFVSLEDESINEVVTSHGFNPSVVKYENMIVSSFDIEMIPEKEGRFPDADKNPKDSIFMICMTYHFAKRTEDILSVCLTLKESDPLDEVFMVHCKSERCLLAAFAKFNEFMQPDFITEFNGGGFDWRNVITKTRICGVLNQFLESMSIVKLAPWEKQLSMLSRFHRESKIKINGATADSICKGLKMQGFIGFDTLVVFKQLEPNADSHKLNECLKRCNLGSKDDLDVQEMFRIYRKGTKAEMSLVAHYCFIDTFKLQQLLIKKNVIRERREVANLSYTSLYDNFYYAGGSRMRNLLMNRGSKLGYFFDTQYRPEIEDPDAKFPGAYVVPPMKGIVAPMLRLDEYVNLHKIECDDSSLTKGYEFIENNFQSMFQKKNGNTFDETKVPECVKSYIGYARENINHYPVSGLDFASLYPSIIMTYNISPEKLIIDEETAKQVESMGETLQFVTFPFCGKMVKAWFVRHNNVEDNYSVCGKLLIELFDRRAAIKKILKHYNEQLYEMEMEMKTYSKSSEYPRIEEYNETKFNYDGYDSKQKAVKIFMNTLYGEMGNFVSCICAVQVAASVTTMGRYNLQLAKSFVENELEMKTYYGDTDSLYVACSPKHFLKYDQEYFTGKIDKLTYGTKIVEETFTQIEIAKTRVNQHLLEDNGSKFLKMAYEEVLYPVAFLSKKKYYGIPHEENVNFYPKKLFIRGLEVVKRGASNVLKDVIDKVLRELMDIHNTRDVIDVIKTAISRVFTTNWSIDAFAKTKVYRPDKKNISVLTMVSRYRKMNYRIIPEPNVRFKYVICKYYPWTFDVEGKIQYKMSIGDRMELLERVDDEGLEIDLEYYFDNELTGQFARLITFCDEFKESTSGIEIVNTSGMTEMDADIVNKENYQKIEDTLFKAAKKYITGLAKHYSNAYVNKGSLFKSTWVEVGRYIGQNPKLQRNHISFIQSIVMNMFAMTTTDSRTESHICDSLLHWVTKHAMAKYQTSLNDKQLSELQKRFAKIHSIIEESNAHDALFNPIDTWKKRINEYIRTEYAYDYICKNNLSYDTLWDVMSSDELESILQMTEMFPTLDDHIGMRIIDIISESISQVLPTSAMVM